MATYEQIAKANETLRTTSIERKKKNADGSYSIVSKDYAEVNQRIKAFRMVYPNGTIETEIISHENGIVLMKSRILDENGKLIGTGFAQEDKKASAINGTSYIENCETSAIGRALGMCGFGIDTSIASAEEVKNAIEQQNTDTGEPITSKQLEYIEKLPIDQIAKILRYYKVERTRDMTKAMATDCINKLRGKNG